MNPLFSQKYNALNEESKAMSLSSQKLRPVVSLDLTIDTKTMLDESIHCHTCCMNTNSTQSQANLTAQKCEASTQTMNDGGDVNSSVCSGNGSSVGVGGGGSSSTSSISSVLKSKRYDYLMHHQLTRDSGIDSDHQQQQKIKQEPLSSLIKMSSNMNRKQQMVINAQQQQHSGVENYAHQDCNQNDDDNDEDDEEDEDEDEKQNSKTYHASSTRDNSPENQNSLDEMTNDVVMDLFNKNVNDEDNAVDPNDDQQSRQETYKNSQARSVASLHESALKKRLSFRSIAYFLSS